MSVAAAQAPPAAAAAAGIDAAAYGRLANTLFGAWWLARLSEPDACHDACRTKEGT